MTPAEKQEVIWMFLDQGLSYKERSRYCSSNIYGKEAAIPD